MTTDSEKMAMDFSEQQAAARKAAERLPRTTMSPAKMKISPKKMPLAEARRLAEASARVASQFCTRVEIAGSIRRLRPVCGDVDLVVMPKSHQAWLELIERMKLRMELEICGDDNLIAVHRENHWQLDIFRAREGEPGLFGEDEPDNFGTIFLIRTGSRFHNIWLCSQAAAIGLHLNPQRGVMKSGRVIASRTEEEIFEALNLKFLAPEKRER